jgi:hypothetical protein
MGSAATPQTELGFPGGMLDSHESIAPRVAALDPLRIPSIAAESPLANGVSACQLRSVSGSTAVENIEGHVERTIRQVLDRHGFSQS